MEGEGGSAQLRPWGRKVTKVCAPIEEAAPLVPAAPPPLFGNATEEGKFVMGLMTSFKVQLGRSNAVLYLAFDGVLNFTGDAIVNATNEGCLGDGGIDGEVSYRGGTELQKAREFRPLRNPDIKKHNHAFCQKI